jgi:adenylate cyclase
MAAVASADISLLDDFRFDRHGRVLFRQDQRGVFAPVAIGSRAFDILGLLVAHPGDLVSRDDIMKAAWPGTVVEDGNLSVQISALRRILDAGRLEGSCIQTVSGRGYRFVGRATQKNLNAGLVIERLEQVNVRTGPSFSMIVPPSFANQSDDTEQQYTPAAEAVSALPKPEVRTNSLGIQTSFLRRHVTAVALAGLLIIAGGLWWLWSSPVTPSTRALETVTATMASLSAPRLSMVVLPLNNLSNDPEQQYFADGLTEDLTTDLSRIAGSFVISRNTAFTYRDKPADSKQVGRELGVRYVLEGSVRRSGKQVRVNVQLIDAATGAHLWAERFESDTVDLFALQNEVTGRIAIALNLALVGAEAARPTANPDALDYIFRGRALFLKSWSRESRTEAISLFERALALDPGSARIQLLLAGAIVGRVVDGMSNTAAIDIARAEGLVAQATAVSPDTPLAHSVKGFLLRAQERWADAIPEYEAVIALNRNWPDAYHSLAQCNLYTGSFEEVVPLLEQAIRLSPRDPALGIWYLVIGRTHLLQSRTDEAIVWLEKARSANPAHPTIRGLLASAYGNKGESERAATELGAARGLSADDRYSSIARMRAVGTFGVPKVRALFETTFIKGLRLAGMPEE